LALDIRNGPRQSKMPDNQLTGWLLMRGGCAAITNKWNIGLKQLSKLTPIHTVWCSTENGPHFCTPEMYLQWGTDHHPLHNSQRTTMQRSPDSQGSCGVGDLPVPGGLISIML
jgi:hypothetical protein